MPEMLGTIGTSQQRRAHPLVGALGRRGSRIPQNRPFRIQNGVAESEAVTALLFSKSLRLRNLDLILKLALRLQEN